MADEKKSSSWLTSIRPRFNKVFGQQRETPDNLWHKCKKCGQMNFHRDLTAALYVCPNCNYHMRLGAKERLDSVFDRSDYRVIDLPDVTTDPLRFRDEKKYTDRLRDARSKTQMKDAIIVGLGKIDDVDAVAVAQDFSFMGGSMGMATGEAIITAANLAVTKKAPLIIFAASGGARMQEGILSLMQLPRTTVAVNLVKEAGLPYIVVQTDPTTGGVSASYAMLGDIHISEPNATIGFAGKRVIEQTIREKLPDGFQTAEYLLEHGMVDMVVHRSQMKSTLSRVLRHLLNRGPAPEGAENDPLPLEAPKPTNTPVDSASTGANEAEPPSPLLSTP